MPKVPIESIESGYRAVEQQNTIFEDIQTAFDNTLSRDGTSPNFMQAPLDMNSNRVINVGAPLHPTDGARLQDIIDAAGDGLVIIGDGSGTISLDWSTITGKPDTYPPTVEAVQDLVASQLVAGTNVTLSYDDTAGTLTINATGGGGGGGASVVDSIADGDTTNAPSRNAVFDALALKLNTSAVTSSITNGDTTHVPTSDAVYDAIAAIPSATVINSIASGDTTNAPSRDAVYTALAGKLATTVVTSSVTNGDTTHVPTSDAVYDAIAAVGTGATSRFKTLKDYGSTEDGVTDDKTAFDAAIADTTTKRIYIEGTAATSNTFEQLNKYFYGPGKIILTGTSKKLPARATDITSLPTQGTGSDVNYYYSSDTSKVDAEYFRLGQPSGGTNFRENLTKSIGGAFPYFEASTTPHFWTFQNYVGSSGTTCRTTTTITGGVSTSVSVNSASGLTTGDTVGFVNSAGDITETKAITVSGTTLSWTGALSNTYPSGTKITKGFRTMNPMMYGSVTHNGAGDSYVHVGRASCGYTPLAGQSHFFDTATVGLYGGDIAFQSSGVYGTGIEIQVADQGNDVAAIGDVYTYNRTSNTGARAVGWIGTLHKSEGSTPINVFHTVAGAANVGFDTVRGDFSSNSQAAYQMKKAQRFYFNSSVNDAATTKMGSNGTYPTLYGNTVGDSYITMDSDGTSNYVDIFSGSSYRVRIRSNGQLNFNGDIQAGGIMNASGNIYSQSGNIYATSGFVNAGSLISNAYVNATTYYAVGGTQVVGARAGSIPDAVYGTEAATCNSILAVMRSHGLISS